MSLANNVRQRETKPYRICALSGLGHICTLTCGFAEKAIGYALLSGGICLVSRCIARFASTARQPRRARSVT